MTKKLLVVAGAQLPVVASSVRTLNVKCQFADSVKAGVASIMCSYNVRLPDPSLIEDMASVLGD